MAGWLLRRVGFNRGSSDRRLLARPKQALELGDLYRTRGVYTYSGGWNWRAVVATLVGCALAWAVRARASGLVVPLLQMFYDYAWFVGLALRRALTCC